MERSARLCFVSLVLALRMPAYGAMEPQSAAKPAPQIVTSDSPHTTPEGATFLVPAGWSVASDASSATLQPPEPDTHIAIFDVHAGDAAAAVSSAWGTFRPGMKRPLKLAVSIPDRNGWTGSKQFIYETSPNERAVVIAIALHSGETWTVVLADGTEPTFEKRSAQVNVVIESLRPKGTRVNRSLGAKRLRSRPSALKC